MAIEKPVLQVALDAIHLNRALQIAEEAVKGGADWLEAGTPLIKSEGLESVRELKRRFSNLKIVADMKTMDVGALEVEMAAKAGADVVTILGVSDDGTIKEAVKAGKKYGTKIMIDLIGVEDKAKRAKEVEELGVDYVVMHVGIDQQMKGKNPIEELKKIHGSTKLQIGAAGGINTENVLGVLEAGASIIIVGGAIIKSENVTEATRMMKEAILSKKSLTTELYKKYSENELRDAFMKVSTSNISDAMHRKGAMFGLKSILQPGSKMVGRALTVRTIDGDWAKPVEAIDKAEKGDVIVIDACGGRIALWGELASWSAKVKGLAGVVVDGAVRDIPDILSLGFPVFAKHMVPNAGEPKGHGEIGVEIVCCGQTVRTGDWIIGDASGVVVVPQEEAVEIANRAIDVMERENRLREEIKRGSTLSKVLELEKWEKVG